MPNGSVRLIKSGIALATPMKLKHVRYVHVTAKPVIQNLTSRRQCREDDKRPSVRGVFTVQSMHHVL